MGKPFEDFEIRLITDLEDILEHMLEIAHRLMVVYGKQKFNFFHNTQEGKESCPEHISLALKKSFYAL